MNTLGVERRFAQAARLLTMFAVLSSSAGGALMILIGLKETVMAFVTQFRPLSGALPAGDASTVHLISALDRFLMAIVLFYFAYGIYLLFVRPYHSAEELGIPPWLRVDGIGQLKQTLAEVIIVILFVLFLRVAVETFVAHGPDLTWLGILRLLVLPVSILLLAAALRLAELHPKH